MKNEGHKARGCLWLSPRSHSLTDANGQWLWHRRLCHRHPAKDRETRFFRKNRVSERQGYNFFSISDAAPIS